MMSKKPALAVLAMLGVAVALLCAAQFPIGTPPQFNAPAPVQQVAGVFVSYSPTQLGANAITLPASGTTALTNIIDIRGVKQLSLTHTRTQGYGTNFQLYAEDGTTTTVNNAFIPTTGAYSAGQADSITVGSESSMGTTPAGKTLSQTFRPPQRAVAFSFGNAGATAGTCTARLFLAY